MLLTEAGNDPETFAVYRRKTSSRIEETKAFVVTRLHRLPFLVYFVYMLLQYKNIYTILSAMPASH